MRPLLGLIMAGLLLIGQQAGAADWTIPRSVTYAVLAEKAKGPHCTAVAVGPNLFLTASHCIVLDRELIVADQKKSAPIKVQLVKADPRLDLALLQAVSPLKVPFVRLLENAPAIDQDMILVGFPLGNFETVTTGHVQHLEDHLMFASAPIIYGNSGGPAMVQVDGKWYLIGIASRVGVANDTPVTHYGVYTNLSAIKAFLKGLI